LSKYTCSYFTILYVHFIKLIPVCISRHIIMFKIKFSIDLLILIVNKYYWNHQKCVWMHRHTHTHTAQHAHAPRVVQGFFMTVFQISFKSRGYGIQIWNFVFYFFNIHQKIWKFKYISILVSNLSCSLLLAQCHVQYRF